MNDNNLDNWTLAIILVCIILFADAFSEIAADFLFSLF
jgi:hypothetical protein